MRMGPEAQLAAGLVNYYTLTVTARDLEEPIYVTTLDFDTSRTDSVFIEEGAWVFRAVIPEGLDRRFTVRGWQLDLFGGDAPPESTLVLIGSAVANVASGVPLDLDIMLRPVQSLLRPNPSFQRVIGGATVAITMELINTSIDSIYFLGFDLNINTIANRNTFFDVDSIVVSPQLGPDVFADNFNEGSFVGINIGKNTQAPFGLVPLGGRSDIVTIYGRAFGPSGTTDSLILDPPNSIFMSRPDTTGQSTSIDSDSLRTDFGLIEVFFPIDTSDGR